MPQTSRLKGIDLAPSGKHAPEPRRNFHRIRHVTGATAPKGAAEEPLATQATILISESGDETAILPSATGPYTVDWISGSEVDPMKDDLTTGGFIPAEKVSQLSEQSKPNQASIQASKESLVKLFKELGLIDERGGSSRRQSSPTRSNTGQVAGQVTPQPQQAGTEGGSPGGNADKPSFMDGLPDAAQSTAANIIAGALSNAELGKEIFRAGDLMQNLVGGLASMGQAYLVEKFFGGMKPDDESSTLDWAMYALGPNLAKSAFSGPLSDVGSRLIFNIPGPYESPALRKGDHDDAINTITEGFESVLIEGKAAARSGDKLDMLGNPLGVFCQWGADKVLIGSVPAARLDTASPGYGTLSYPTLVPFTVCGAARTRIGGVTNCPNPPPPSSFGESGIPTPPEGTNPVADPDTDPPKSGMYWDPKAQEWRMWDPKFGWSSTPSESYANNAFFGTLPDWKRDPSFTYLGLLKNNPLWNLGTMEWPGAGQAGNWWVPDQILPGIFSGDWAIDMKQAMSNLHDWLFHPDNTGDHSLWSHLVNTEWKVVMQGWTRNPLQWLFKVGYSTATTLATLVFYLDSYLNAIDEGSVSHAHPRGSRT